MARMKFEKNLSEEEDSALVIFTRRFVRGMEDTLILSHKRRVNYFSVRWISLCRTEPRFSCIRESILQYPFDITIEHRTPL